MAEIIGFKGGEYQKEVNLAYESGPSELDPHHGEEMTREELQAMLGQFRAEAEALKSDSRAFQSDIKATLSEIRSASGRATEETRALGAELRGSRDTARAEMETLRSDNQAFHADVRADLERVHGDNRETKAAVDGVRHTQNVTTAWSTAVLGGLIAIVLAISGYMLSHVSDLNVRLARLGDNIEEIGSAVVTTGRESVGQLQEIDKRINDIEIRLRPPGSDRGPLDRPDVGPTAPDE